MIPASVQKRVTNLIVLTGPATTLAISPWFNFDPINPVKVLVLSCIAFASLGLLVPYLSQFKSKLDKATSSIVIFFFLAMASSFFFSGADKGQQFWGVFGRNTGILTYVALAFVFLIAASILNLDSYKRIIWSLVGTSAIMTVYCLIQIAGLDPVNWSAFFPFGTLGNVNFLSGFLGISLVSIFILSFNKFIRNRIRVFLILVFPLGLFALYKSDSTQGFVALAVGIGSYLVIRSYFVSKWIFVLSISLFLSALFALVLGLSDRGPLRGLIYQFTVLYRADYMHAAYKMLIDNPWTGVGIDSYDDWYRSERGLISAFRTGFNRTANSAHNISLDLAAGGGLPLLVAYLALIFLVAFAVLRGLRNGLHKDSVFMALSMSWVAYQVQATVSINQVGVGVWGWILAGSILGYLRAFLLGNSTLEDKPSSNRKRDSRVTRSNAEPNTPPAKAVLASAAFLGFGFVISFLPMKTDMDFLAATKTGSAEELLEVTGRTSANTFMLARAASGALESNLSEPTRILINRLTDRFPRNLYGQLVKKESSFFSEDERNLAFERIKTLDPFVALCYEPDTTSKISSLMAKVASDDAFELARGWGLIPTKSHLNPRNFSWSQLDSQQLRTKLDSFCGM